MYIDIYIFGEYLPFSKFFGISALGGTCSYVNEDARGKYGIKKIWDKENIDKIAKRGIKNI